MTANVSNVDCEYTDDFPEILRQLLCWLLISTYLAGKVIVVGVHYGALQLPNCRHFLQSKFNANSAYPGYLKPKDKNELAPSIQIPTNTPPIFLVHGSDDVISLQSTA